MTPLISRRQAVAAQRRGPADSPTPAVDIPDIDQWVARTQQLSDVRWDKVQALRTAIAAGRYDVDARMETLLDRIPTDLAQLLKP